MKNLIKILLYLLLVLLVVAISVIMYKKFKSPSETDNTAETLETAMQDSATVDNMALTAEDSVILGLKADGNAAAVPGESASVDPMSTQSQTVGQTADPAMTSTAQAVQQENVSPVAKQVNHSESKTESKKAEVKKKSESQTSSIPASSKTGKFYVVAGSYIVPTHADKQVSKLKKMGYKSANSKVFGTDEYYRAIAGQYETRESADKVVRNLKSKGIEAFVKTK